MDPAMAVAVVSTVISRGRHGAGRVDTGAEAGGPGNAVTWGRGRGRPAGCVPMAAGDLAAWFRCAPNGSASTTTTTTGWCGS